MPDLTMPLLHMNGTSRAELISQQRESHIALHRAINVLSSAPPNGRDYYPLGDHALRQAQAEHRARVQRLVDVQSEIEAIWENLNDQKGGR